MAAMKNRAPKKSKTRKSRKQAKKPRAAASKKNSAAVPADTPIHDKQFPIVGIGASAGGLEAFEQLLEGMPLTTGMALVLVPHLAPRHESMLTELLSKRTNLPVIQVTEGMRVRPNHVYVIPPNAEM